MIINGKHWTQYKAEAPVVLTAKDKDGVTVPFTVAVAGWQRVSEHVELFIGAGISIRLSLPDIGTWFDIHG